MSKHYINQKYLHKWEDYINGLPKGETGLLPLWIDLDGPKIVRKIISKKDVARLYRRFKKNQDLPGYIIGNPAVDGLPNATSVFKNYIANYGGTETPKKSLNPLDAYTNRPILILYMIQHKETTKSKFRFSKDIQYSCDNDADDLTRNLFKVCTVDNDPTHGAKGLIMYDACRSNIPDLKYNLHVTIMQKVKNNRNKDEWAETPIIIDPGVGNNGNWPS